LFNVSAMPSSHISKITYQYLRPSQVFESIYDIDFGSFWDEGIRHLFFDVDNTLISYKETNVSIQCLNLFNSIKSIEFDNVILVSNNSSVDRIQKVAKSLDLPGVSFACKPFVFTMRRIMTQLNVDPSKSAFIGDQLLTDVLMANLLNMTSIFVDPIDLSNISITKSIQYKLQLQIMRSFYR
tara:strand:- start:21 stop:566 length:546 start_codon:yes stop_codon:yes gene_type:complete